MRYIINILLSYLLLLNVFGNSYSRAYNGQLVKEPRNVIYTSSLKKWTPSTLEEIITHCKEGSVIIFDADFDYTIDRCIKPKVSISIDGCGKIIRTINKYNYVISLFDVHDVDSFAIQNLILDGSYSTSKSDNTIPKEFFITVKNVKNVTFKRCTFQNIRTEYPNWKEGDQPYTIWVENYDKFVFCDNVVTNCDCPEFLFAVQPINNTNQNVIADISRNKMDFVRTSSAIEVRFGRYRINNNIIGVTQGSTINAYGYNSEIIGNVFKGSHNSSTIDLSEDFTFKYVSSNILVKNNYSEYSHDGFLSADHVSNIQISDNVFRSDIYDEEIHERYNRQWTKVNKRNDFALRLEHDLSNIIILSNCFIGCRALFSFSSLGAKNNIKVENNYIECIPETERSVIVLTQTRNIIINNNVFINTGGTLSYLDKPQFIVIGPTILSDASKRFIDSVKVTGNTFSFKGKDIKEAYIMAHSLYDKANCNTLSTLNNISLERNKSKFRGDILLVTDDFNNPLGASISIINNDFKSGQIQGNIVANNTIRNIRRMAPLKSNTVIEKDGRKYYVIVGGLTSIINVDYNKDGYIMDGSVILRRIKYPR